MFLWGKEMRQEIKDALEVLQGATEEEGRYIIATLTPLFPDAVICSVGPAYQAEKRRLERIASEKHNAIACMASMISSKRLSDDFKRTLEIITMHGMGSMTGVEPVIRDLRDKLAEKSGYDVSLLEWKK